MATENIDELLEKDDDTLVFPMNVHESLQSAGGLKKSEKTSIIISFWVVACLALAWFLAGWLRQIVPQHYVLVVILVEIALQLTVGNILVRWMFDERALAAELKGGNNLFARYFGIYREHIAGEDSPYPFDFIEFSDGSYGVYIQFLLGYNTTQASRATYAVNKEVQRIINRSGLSHRVIFMNEKFSNSSAAEELRKVVRNIEDPRLFSAYRDIVQGILTAANRESNVLCMTYVLYAKTTIQKEELTKTVNSILGAVKAEDTAYREVTTMSFDDIVEFYRIYYKLDILDMGLIRAHAGKKSMVSCALKLLRVYGKSGKVYNTPEMERLVSNVLEGSGLTQVNKGAK